MDGRIGGLPGLSVVVPTFRSPGTLERLVLEIDTHVRPLTERLELVFVDDGNVDGTWDVVTDLARRYDWVRGIRLLRNYGQHNALLAGLRSVRQPFVLTLDDDLQNPPAEVPKLIAAMTDDVDLVYGTPAVERHGRGRNLASTTTKRAMVRFLGPDVFPRSGPFRLFRRELLAATVQADDPYVSIDVLLSWGTARIRAVEVDYADRASGESGYSFGKLVRHAFNMITGYSTRPLRIVSLLGFVLAGFGFALLAYVMVRFALGQADVPGFTFLAATISLFSGVQLLSLGVVGEYLSRMHFRSMGRPAYVVRDETTAG